MKGKGLDLLLEAFSRAAAGGDARLLIGGDGPDRDAVVALARRLGVEDRVEMLGRIEGRARFELLAGAQVVAFPTRYESFGLVALEAMACATPVVAFDIPCLRDLLAEDCAVTVPAFDVGAFAEALRTLLADPDRCREMGERGRSRSITFDWAEIAARQELVYAAAAGYEDENGDRRIAHSFSHS
jgi:glycosyltransferase involved in cell wall biosynthesis